MDLQVYHRKTNFQKDFIDQRFENRERGLRKDEFQSLDVFMNGASGKQLNDFETYLNGHLERKPRYTR